MGSPARKAACGFRAHNQRYAGLTCPDCPDRPGGEGKEDMAVFKLPKHLQAPRNVWVLLATFSSPGHSFPDKIHLETCERSSEAGFLWETTHKDTWWVAVSRVVGKEPKARAERDMLK